MNVINKSVLITGCYSGIGQYLANTLQKDGWQVIATDKIIEGDMLPLDLTDSGSIKRAVKQAENMTEGKLYALINNAGVAYAGKLEDISRDDMRRQFEINVFGAHELTNQVIPIFKRNRIGRIVNISSINGRVSFPYMGAYSASKFALEALSDALRIELGGTGIKVSIIEPGTIETNFRKNAVCRNFVLKDKKGKTPDIIYRKVKHALESKNPKARYLAGNGYIVYLRQFLPTKLFDIVMSFAVEDK